MRAIVLVFKLVIAAVIALLLIMLVNMLMKGATQLDVEPIAPLAVDADGVSKRLAGAIQIQTISVDDRDSHISDPAFQALHAYLKQHYPLVFNTLTVEKVDRHSLMLHWQGSDSSLLPAMMMAHQDVVPVAPGTEGEWLHPPFSGEIADGFVWGRGAWDNKSGLMGWMEALELLLATDVKPSRSVYFAFGHDEETGGLDGAQNVAALLAKRGVKLEFVLDEGLIITEGIIGGLASPAAIIGIGEKGYVTLALDASASTGHSSMPPRDSAIGAVSQAVSKLDANRFPAQIAGVALKTFSTLAPHMDLLPRLMLSNLWLTESLVRPQLENAKATNALLRTTTAMTVFQAGNKDNVMPAKARALVNFRILPGETIASVIARVHQVIDDSSIKVSIFDSSSEPSPLSSTESTGFKLIERGVREVFNDALVAPGLMIAGTDSKFMQSIANDVYRFSPVRAGSADLGRFHGTNERLSVANYVDAIRFYHRILTLAAMPK